MRNETSGLIYKSLAWISQCTFRHSHRSHGAQSNAALLLALLLAVGLPCLCRAGEYRAFWLDAFHDGFFNQSQVDTLLGVPGTTSTGRIRDVNCNAIVVQVRKRADVCYPSGVGEPYMSNLSPTNFNALAALIKAAHDTTGGKKRIEVHCWSVAFKTAKGLVYSQHSDPPTGSLTTFDNYWPTRVSSTSGSENADGAFDPGHPKCLEYLVNAHMDLVNFQTTAGPDGTDGHLDGIHYDYIRFEASTEGYNPTSVARYNARYGLSGDPASTSEQFKQWRRDQVSAFVRQMYARVQKTKPWVKQSGAFVTWNPSPTSFTRAAFLATRPYYDVYSDWDSWMEEGIVDLGIPMAYYRQHTMPDDYLRWINFIKDRQFNRQAVIGPGMYLNSLENAILQLNLTRTSSPAGNYAQGFCGYSYAVPYTNLLTGTGYGTWDGFAPSLLSDVTPTWDDIPDMPWKSAPTNGHVMGTVTIADTGAWADFATVAVTGPTNRSLMVDGTGFYAFIDLPPGSYTVTASKSGYPNASASVNVAVGQVTGNMYEQNLVLGGDTPPSITGQPQSHTVGQGFDAVFAVSASGTPPLGYQWRWYGTNISGATASSYTRANVQPADAGPYSVVVTNSFGSVTSSNALLAVDTNITLTVSASAGGAVYKYPDQASYGFDSAVTLVAAPVLGWNFSGWAGDASGSANPLTVILIHNLSVAGNFTSSVAELIVDNPQAVTTGSWTTRTTGSGYYGANFITAATVSGSATATASYTPTIVTAGNYDVYVLYVASGTPSTAAPYLLSYDGGTTNFTINQQANQGQWVMVASGIRFAAGTSGFLRLFNNTGETSRRVIADAVRWVYSAGQDAPPIIIAQPQDQSADAGSSVTFSVVAAGTPAPDYQWWFNGAPIAGATDSAYIRSSLQTTDAGSYSVVVSNRVASLASSNAVLTVLDPAPPRIDSIHLLSDGRIQLQISADPGQYGIEVTTNLADWAELTNLTTAGATFEYTDGETNLAQRFYRMRLIP